MEPEKSPAPAAAEGGSLSTSAAAEMLVNIENKPEPQAPENPPEIAAAEEAPQETEQPAAEAAPAEQAEPEEQSYDLEKIHGNTKVRLRDGTEWTAAELKRRISDLKEVDQRRQAFEQDAQKVNAAKQWLAQQAQLLQTTLPAAIATLQAQIPPEPQLPPDDLADSDPFAHQKQMVQYHKAKTAREQKLAQLAQLQSAQQQQALQAQQQQQQHIQGLVRQEQTKLLERMPELKDEGKRREFYNDYMATAQRYGFTPAEAQNVFDHRLLMMVKDAAAYHKMKADKPKVVQKVQQKAPPVQSPGQRASEAERSVQKRQELIQRAKSRGGNIEDIAAAIAQLS